MPDHRAHERGDEMLTDEQARWLVLALLGFVTAMVTYGFIRALTTGEVGIGYQPHSAITKIVRRSEHPGHYWRIMLGWAFLVLVGFGLLAIPVFVM